MAKKAETPKDTGISDKKAGELFREFNARVSRLSPARRDEQAKRIGSIAPSGPIAGIVFISLGLVGTAEAAKQIGNGATFFHEDNGGKATEGQNYIVHGKEAIWALGHIGHSGVDERARREAAIQLGKGLFTMHYPEEAIVALADMKIPEAATQLAEVGIKTGHHALVLNKLAFMHREFAVPQEDLDLQASIVEAIDVLIDDIKNDRILERLKPMKPDERLTLKYALKHVQDDGLWDGEPEDLVAWYDNALAAFHGIAPQGDQPAAAPAG